LAIASGSQDSSDEVDNGGVAREILMTGERRLISMRVFVAGGTGGLW